MTKSQVKSATNARIPVLESLGEFLRARAEVEQLVVERIDVDVHPLDVVEPVDALDDVVIESVQLVEQRQLSQGSK